MATAYARPEGGTLTEENGEIVAASENWVVPDISTSPVVFTAMEATGLPEAGDALNASYPNVKVKSRQITEIVRQNDTSTWTAYITITYELDRPEAEVTFSLRGGASVNQIETDKDRSGNPIELTYGSKTVRATANVLDVQATFQCEIVETTNDPDGVVAQYVNHVNDSPFRGKPAGYWLCTHVEYEPRDLSNTQNREYRFGYEFSGKEEGWLYTVAYKGDDGYIPDDVVEGTGIKDIEWHPERNFALKFGA